MPHKRSPEATERRAPAALHVAMAHARQREAAVAQREERVRRREALAPDLNADLMRLAMDMQEALQAATNLAGHHLTDEHDEKATAISSAMNRRARAPCPCAPALPALP